MSDNKKFPPGSDPDATLSSPLVPPAADPEATLSAPFIKDPEQTITSRDLDFDLSEPPGPDPAPASKPAPKPEPGAAKEDDPEATFSGPLPKFDPDTTISSPMGLRRRANPFAPKALPEALQANLAALGGLNQLVAFANPILSAVPQIAAAREHPDPGRLKETLQDLIEAFEAGASKSGETAETVEAAVFALCCLCDDAAASTPWGKDWIALGLQKAMRGDATGSEEFFSLVAERQQKPQENADLLELLYICLALGFQGRYRGADGAAEPGELKRIRSELHALITRRRGRPSGLSERWRPAGPGAVAALRHAAPESSAIPWRMIAAPVSALVVLVIAYKAFQRSDPPPIVVPPVPPVAEAPATTPVVAPVSAAPAVTPAPEPVLSTQQALEKELAPEVKGGIITLASDAGRTVIAFRDDRQFPSGNSEPSAAIKALIERVAVAIDGTGGPVIVRGYSDNAALHAGPYASNTELSAARAKAIATMLAAKVKQPQRVSSEGVGEANPIAPNDSAENRARNRRIAILVGP